VSISVLDGPLEVVKPNFPIIRLRVNKPGSLWYASSMALPPLGHNTGGNVSPLSLL